VVRIRLFGGVGATTDDGEPVDIGSARSQTVLAALALSPGSAVPVPRLIDLVYGDAPPTTAEKALQWHIARLRRSLGHRAIVRNGAAYSLDVEPEAVDVARFRRHLDAGDIDAALGEWTGTPLAGLDAPGLAATVTGLVEQWLSAVEVAVQRRVETDPQAAVGPLTELTARHPFREGLWALLMTALYRAGRQADALAAFRSARQHLVEQLGVEPGPRLRELETMILGHDARLDGGRAAATVTSGWVETGGTVAAAPNGNLPRSPDRLIGRDEELETIGAALVGSPVVTLVGPGGIGKTRLALAAARAAADAHPGGAWLADLAPITSPGDVPRAVADVLGVTQRRGRTLTESIITALRSRPALLVLDNCEHVIDGAAELAHAVVEGCPDARVLATSRERLRIGGERLLAVGPLDPAGAGGALFRERAVAADPAFDPQAHRAEVEEICRRLDGIPLAIELAAARASSLSPPDLLARLDGWLRLLTGGRRSAAGRHRTLRSAVQWSYDLLTPAERTLFRRLSIFAGPFDLAAAEAVAADPELDVLGVDDLLGGLVERSMLVAEPGALRRRFRLLETMRQFGAEQLRAGGELDRVADRHARWCLGEVTEIHRLLAGPAEIGGVARLAELWPNLRAAVDHACAQRDPGSAEALVRPVVTELPLRGRHEIGDWAERIIATTPADDRARLGFWRIWAAERYTQNGDHQAYADLVRRRPPNEHPLARYADAYLAGDGAQLWRCLPDATAELRRQDDAYLAEFLEVMAAGLLLGIGRFADVEALADRYRAQGPPTLRHWMLQTHGYCASFQGRRDQAERLFAESIDIRVPDGTLSANKLIQARVVFRRGDRSRALRIIRSYIDDLVEADDVVAGSVVCVEFITMMATLGRLAEAAVMLGYLEASNEFGAFASKTLVAQAAGVIAAGTGPTLEPLKDSGRRLDDRRALEHMRDILDGLVPPT